MANRTRPASCSLERFSQDLRPYQLDVLADASAFIDRVVHDEPAGPGVDRRRLYVQPTGTGKGTEILAIARDLGAAEFRTKIVTNSLDVIRGFLERCGLPDTSELGGAALWREADACGITTAIRLRNAIISGAEPPPDAIVWDEAHHSIEEAKVAGDLLACCPYSVVLGFSACGYRGTPTGTNSLKATFGEPIEVMSWPEAVAEDWATMPTCEVVGLLDDDVVRVSGGEFVGRSVDTAWQAQLDEKREAGARAYKGLARIDALAALISRFIRREPRYGLPGDLEPETSPTLDVPTMVALPSGDLCRLLAERLLDRHGIRSALVLQDTATRDRSAAFNACRARTHVLLQVSVVGEGVDLPWLQRLIDARPTMSPVRFVQLFGRITRPGLAREYICCCRNYERHSYLLGGLCPPAAIKAAQDQFTQPSRNDIARHVGLETLGRFKPVSVPLLDGRRAQLWSVYSTGDAGKIEWAALLIPGQAQALVARRTVGITPNYEEKLEAWAKLPEDSRGAPPQKWNYDARPAWVRWDALPESFSGFGSTQERGALSPKQEQFWRNLAGIKGLAADPFEAGITRRHMVALAMLKDTGLRIAL